MSEATARGGTRTLCLVGCGSAFDTIAGEPDAYAGHGPWLLRPAESVARLAATRHHLLEGLDPATTQLFVAVDSNALNYARLELYGAARLAGFRMVSLVHARAWVAPGATLADNVWIGPGASVSPGCVLAGDVLVNPAARLDTGASVGMHGWIGPGASIGSGASVGPHSVIGAGVFLRGGLKVGRHCVLDRAGAWQRDLPDGSLVEPEFDAPARIVGPGYSFQKIQQRS